MLPELTQRDYSAALDAVAGSVLAALPIDEPPVDALALARALNLAVAWDDGQRGRGRIVRLHGHGAAPRGSILLRHDPRPERLQWAIAHEIGETCAQLVFDHLCVDPREAPPQAREAVANQLAGRLLLPNAWFALDAPQCGWDLPQLKARYSTASHELIARRMLDFPAPITIAIFDHARLTFRRANVPGRPATLLPPEQIAWRIAHDDSQPAVESDAVCRVQAWCVHEPDWKREILRTEWHEIDADVQID
jgi:predicted transcriptional regulator